MTIYDGISDVQGILQNCLDAKGNIKDTLVSKGVFTPDNSKWSDLVDGIGMIDSGGGGDTPGLKLVSRNTITVQSTTSGANIKYAAPISQLRNRFQTTGHRHYLYAIRLLAANDTADGDYYIASAEQFKVVGADASTVTIQYISNYHKYITATNYQETKDYGVLLGGVSSATNIALTDSQMVLFKLQSTFKLLAGTYEVCIYDLEI